ncbi:MAG: DUF4268 domain-containing protein [Phycisphaerales bacterium]
MPVYKITTDRIDALPATSFVERGIKERADLQRLLRANIAVVAPNVLVIAEEFAEWDDSKRRIDLLGVDDKGNLVVIELKRDDDGSHMELQAIRYAAMVSRMTFARAVEVYQSHLDKHTPGQDARAKLLEFLRWEEPREEEFAADVRIVLVSAEFKKEITTAVLWLNERDLDIRCVRVMPYANGTETIADVQQIIPQPDIAERLIQIKQKEQAERTEKATRHSERRAFWNAALPVVAAALPRWKNISAGDDGWLNATSGRPGVALQLWSYVDQCGSSLYLDGGAMRPTWAKAIFDALHESRSQIEAEFGGPLEWNRLDEKRASIIASKSIKTGYRSPRADWAAAHAALASEMKQFESVLLPRVDSAVATVGVTK